MRHPSRKWKIEASTDFVTGEPKWKTTPPRHAYGAGTKHSHDTYDEALAYVQTGTGKRPIVFESKTHIGEWFWHHPEGRCGWEPDRATAHAKANGTHQEEAA